MGFLDKGETLEWHEVIFVIDYIKRHGVKQLLHTVSFSSFFFVGAFSVRCAHRLASVAVECQQRPLL